MNLFKKVKEIRSKKGELHFERYAIVEFARFAVYIHTIHKEDKDKFLHSHPWNFWSMVLKGSYAEKFLGKDVFSESQEFVRLKTPGTTSRADRNFFHKIERIEKGPVTTLFITWGKPEKWYYWINDGLVESSQYRIDKNNGVYD